jgi:hypothetical protein
MQIRKWFRDRLRWQDVPRVSSPQPTFAARTPDSEPDCLVTVDTDTKLTLVSLFIRVYVPRRDAFLTPR